MIVPDSCSTWALPAVSWPLPCKGPPGPAVANAQVITKQRNSCSLMQIVRDCFTLEQTQLQMTGLGFHPGAAHSRCTPYPHSWMQTALYCQRDKNSLAIWMVVCHLSAFSSSSFWISSLSGLAALTTVWLHSGHYCPLLVSSLSDFCTGCVVRRPRGEQVLLITPGLSSHQINMWMETRESPLVQDGCPCIVTAAMGICSSLNTATKPQTEHLWDQARSSL